MPPTAPLDVPGFRLGYRPALDGLRGVALVVVVLFHGHVPGVRAGHAGLTVFFVLSAFLITVLLLQEHREVGHVALGPFYARRFLRIYPGLLVFVLVAAVFVQLTAAPGTAVEQWRSAGWVLAGLANVQHVLGDDRLLLLEHTWSIAVELQFYVLWPLVLLAALRRGVPWQRIVAGSVAAAVAVLLVREVWWLAATQDPTRDGALVALREPALRLAGGPLYPRFLTGTDLRVDHLLVGCIAGLLTYHGWVDRLREHRTATVAASVVAAGYLVWFVTVVDVHDAGWRRFLFSGGSTLVAVAAAVIIVTVVVAPESLVPRLLERRSVVWLGTISYGVYLWHVPIYRLLRQEFGHLPLTQLVPAGAAAAVVLALVSYHGLERWALAQKRRFAPRLGRERTGSARTARPPLP